MIIKTPGKYEIIPMTAKNAVGNYYQVRIAEITAVDPENQKIFCPDFGWIDWDLPLKDEKKGGKHG